MSRRIVPLLTAALLAASVAFTTSPVLAQVGEPPPGPDSLGADWGPQQYEARAAVRQGRYVPLFRVIAEIRRHTPGRQLDAGIEQAGGRAVYRVRWAASNGRRIDYIVDAQSGAILSAN